MVDSRTQMRVTTIYLRLFLLGLVHLVGMTVIMGPVVMRRGNAYDAWVVLAESHCAVHIRDDVVHLDCFSCKPFKIEDALLFSMGRLKLIDVQYQVIARPLPEPVR